jgi:hypothetical protein
MKMSAVKKRSLSGVGDLTATAATPYASYLSTMPALTNTGSVSVTSDTSAPTTATSVDNITQSLSDLANTILGVKASLTPAPKPVTKPVSAASTPGTIAGISIPILLIGGLVAWKLFK